MALRTDLRVPNFNKPVKKYGNDRYKFALIPQLFVKKTSTEFHDNPTIGLADDTTSRAGGRTYMVSTIRVCLLPKEGTYVPTLAIKYEGDEVLLHTFLLLALNDG
jgi:hypothetical protein